MMDDMPETQDMSEAPAENEQSPEEAAGDQDAGPAYDPEQAEIDEQRDQPEG
jgi:hypothetical protein